MQHRHLNHNGYTLAAIDDIIVRGNGHDWIDLGRELHRQPDVIIPKILKITATKIHDPYAQCYHFWDNYAKAKRKEFAS